MREGNGAGVGGCRGRHARCLLGTGRNKAGHDEEVRAVDVGVQAVDGEQVVTRLQEADRGTDICEFIDGCAAVQVEGAGKGIPLRCRGRIPPGNFDTVEVRHVAVIIAHLQEQFVDGVDLCLRLDEKGHADEGTPGGSGHFAFHIEADVFAVIGPGDFVADARFTCLPIGDVGGRGDPFPGIPQGASAVCRGGDQHGSGAVASHQHGDLGLGGLARVTAIQGVIDRARRGVGEAQAQLLGRGISIGGQARDRCFDRGEQSSVAELLDHEVVTYGEEGVSHPVVFAFPFHIPAQGDAAVDVPPAGRLGSEGRPDGVCQRVQAGLVHLGGEGPARAEMLVQSVCKDHAEFLVTAEGIVGGPCGLWAVDAAEIKTGFPVATRGETIVTHGDFSIPGVEEKSPWIPGIARPSPRKPVAVVVPGDLEVAKIGWAEPVMVAAPDATGHGIGKGGHIQVGLDLRIGARIGDALLGKAL